MRFNISLGFIPFGISQFAFTLPGLHSRADSGGVIIVPPPNLSNQTGLKQIPGKLARPPTLALSIANDILYQMQTIHSEHQVLVTKEDHVVSSRNSY